MNSYFEIGGHVVECTTPSAPQSSLPVAAPIAFASRPRGPTGISPRPLARAARHSKSSVAEVGSVPGRARRARMAFTIAGTLAMADGPLPIGDALAIGVLVGYGSYEIYKSSEIILNM